MILTEEKLKQILFICNISSGPPVYIYYSKIEDDIYATLYHRPRHSTDIVIFIAHAPFREESKATDAIKKFLTRELRDIKINKLFGDE